MVITRDHSGEGPMSREDSEFFYRQYMKTINSLFQTKVMIQKGTLDGGDSFVTRVQLQATGDYIQMEGISGCMYDEISRKCLSKIESEIQNLFKF